MIDNAYKRSIESSFLADFEYGLLNMSYGIAEILAGEIKATGYEISWHSGHRPTHTFGGKQFTFKQMETLGITKLLNDYNCRHWKFPVIVGVTPPKYTLEELAALEAAELVKHKWNGKEYTLYELTQIINRYNRMIGKLTREYEVFNSLFRESGAERYKIASDKAMSKLKKRTDEYNHLEDLIKGIYLDFPTQKPDTEDEPESEEADELLNPPYYLNYLSTINIVKKWTVKITNWGKIHGELSVIFKGRLP